MSAEFPGCMRSALFAPGNHERRAEKAFSVGADCVILDLEDSVPPQEKAQARTAIVAALLRPRNCRGFVRVNAAHTGWFEADLSIVVGTWLDGIVLPKVESAEQIRALDERLQELELRVGLAPGRIDVMPLIETARGIANVEAIAGAAPRVRRLAFGGADYVLDLDLQWSVEEQELAYGRARLSHASRLAGIEAPIDTPVVQVKDLERVSASASNGRRMGFQGKLCIHPDQVALCNRVFAPSAVEIERARALIEAFGAAAVSGSGVIQFDGALVDLPLFHKAQRILALADRLAAKREAADGALK